MSRQLYSTYQWRELRKAILERDQYRCKECGRAGRLEVDHIVPIKDGGDELNERNLQTLCRQCHFKKTGTENTERNDRINRKEWIRYRNMLELADNS